MRLDVEVHGEPVGQGNIRHLGKGRPAVHQNAKTLKPWRAAIVRETRYRMTAAGMTTPLDGPLSLWAEFRMTRGKTVKRWKPTVPPDLDHLVRAVCDALKDAQAIADDARIVRMHLDKDYAPDGRQPGVRLSVAPLAIEMAAA
jgi:Holliday junction resolvase RusA-like endonuclease